MLKRSEISWTSERDTVRTKVLGPAVVAALAVGLAFLISYGGMSVILGLIMLPVFGGVVAVIIMNPRIGLIASIHMSFVSEGLKRYLPSLPIGFGVDFLLLITLVATLINIKKEEWNLLPKGLSLLLSGWLLFTVLEVFNPEAESVRGWLSAIRTSSLQFCITIPLALILFKNPKDMRSVIIIWMVWSVLGTLYGIKQLYFGLNSYENDWLATGPFSTHILFGRLRVFSFSGDAGTFGVWQAHACLIAGIIAINEKAILNKILFGSIAVLCFYGMAISGTRGALFVLIVGFTTYFILSKNVKILVAGFVIVAVFLFLLKFTFVGHNNYHIYRLRSALDLNDASFQVRLNNQEKLYTYLASRPFGGGIGSIGYYGKTYSPHTFLASMPTDSWYVRVWAETGWVGLLYYLSMFLYILISGFKKVVKINDETVKYKVLAFYAGVAGIMVASYGNELLASYPVAPMIYISIAFILQKHVYEDFIKNNLK